MALLSQSELDACRAMQRQTFDQTVTLERVSVSSDPWSTSGKDAWANLITGATAVLSLPCRIATPDAKTIQQYQGQLGNVPVYIITYDVSASVLKGDLLLTSDGHTLFIHEILNPHGYETARRAIAAEKQ